jgi:hypothetical protein
VIPRRLRPWLALLLAAAGAPGAGAAPAPSETQLKAAFIFNFTRFVDWPPEALGPGRAPFVIGVFGDEPIDQALGVLVRGEQIDGHPLEVRRLRRPADAVGCQIAYVAANGEDLFRPARLRGDPVLTVGETEDFLASGGMIQLFTDHNHMRLKINLSAARAASLQISSKLLRVAQVLSP